MRAMKKYPPSPKLSSNKAPATVAVSVVVPESLPTKVSFVRVDDDQAGQRLDNFLMARLKGVPKSKIYNIIRKGEVRVNKGRSQPDYKIAANDEIRIPPVRMAEKEPIAKPSNVMTKLLEQSIVFENEGLLIINKPPGLAVHGGSGVSLGLIETLRQMRPEARYLELIHRLDRDTSGCIMIAKKRSMLRHLQAALREKSASGIRKVYQALVIGAWSKQVRHIDAPLLKSEVANDERIVRVHADGKPSLTEFNVLTRYGQCTLIEARPITGRTHQIRVHAQYAGHSLVGDEKYGNDEFNQSMRALGVKRLFLHAAELGFYLPDSKELTVVKAPLAADLAAVLQKLTVEHPSGA